MSTGKRLAKRSIVGTRVCAPGDDGLFYSGVIQSVKTLTEQNECELNVDAVYSVRFDYASKKCPSVKREFSGSEIIGPGFQPLSNFRLSAGQKIFLTYNGREISGHIVHHNSLVDEVTVSIIPPGHEGMIELKKKIEEVRLLESRKSARLMDQDTDFARLADMAADRKRTNELPIAGSRKRRTSSSYDDFKEGNHEMTECTAALVLMSLSCSPNSPLNGQCWLEPLSPTASFSDSASSWRSGTPSPPLSESGNSGIWGSVGTDEGIVLEDDFDDHPRKRKMARTLFRCTWKGCSHQTTECELIELHVRTEHLGPRRDRSVSDNGYDDEDVEIDDHEEEFYYTEVEIEDAYSPTLSHRDMARPPHEDPEYQRSLLTANIHRRFASAGPINIPKSTNSQSLWSFTAGNASTHHHSGSSPVKHLKLMSSSAPASKLPTSPTRRVRGETKKCRKVYGMEHRDMWCTQCKWKKACSRFGD